MEARIVHGRLVAPEWGFFSRPGSLVGVGLALMGAAIGTHFVPAPAALGGWLTGAGLLVPLAGPLFTGRASPFEAEIHLEPGRVRVRRVRRWFARISPLSTFRSRDIVGASTARLGDRVSLVLQVRGRARPLAFELATEAEAKALCTALDVGHGGFGRLDFALGQTAAGRFEALARAVASLAVLALVLAGFPGPGLLGVAFLAGILFAPWTLAYLGNPANRDQTRVALSAAGLGAAVRRRRDGAPARALRARFRDLEAVSVVAPSPGEREGGALRVVTTSGAALDLPLEAPTWVAPPVATEAERAHVVAQVQAAMARAHGAGAAPPEQSDALAALRKRGESGRIYLARLDTTAQLACGGGTYRGPALDRTELWSAVEDPDCDPDVRVGAARVLYRLDPAIAKARVEAAAARARDPSVGRKLRVVISDDLEAAAEDLDALEEAAAAEVGSAA